MTRTVRGMIVITLIFAGALSVGEGSRIYLKAFLAQILLQNAWSQTKDGQQKVAPWPWADTYPVARLEVPAHDANFIVLAGATGPTLAFGPGHLLSSAEPGAKDNHVIVGHRDTHFRFLQDLSIGEPIFLATPDGISHRYVVNQIEVLHQSETEVLERDGVKALTLITCYPFNSLNYGGPLRYVVRAFANEPEIKTNPRPISGET